MSAEFARDMVTQARALREAGHTKRCHTVPTVGEYSVATHCYHAVSLLFVLHGNPSQELVKALLWHDAAERWLGDLPSPAKANFPEMAQYYEAAERAVMAERIGTFALTTDEGRWLKAIDVLELHMWVLDQIAMGNQHVRHMHGVIRKWFLGNEEWIPAAVFLFYSNYTFKRDN
jgi:5'-deoxynucleotidase YfbR-like HD superfamily hydrolase